MQFWKTSLPLLLTILLATVGCSTVPQPAPATGTPTATTNNSGKGQLEKLVDQVAAEAKQTMRSCSATLNDVVVEATPMWSLNYQGEVHVRVYDADGKLILDEYRK